MIGTVDEDFAIESMAGDIFLLGNTSWRIRRVEPGKVRVEDAGGAPPTIPFWLGEAPGAHARAVGRGRRRCARRSPTRDGRAATTGAGARWRGCALDRRGRRAAARLRRRRRARRWAPCRRRRRVIAERFFDEAGGMQLVIHAPFGGRINRAWGLALRKRFCRIVRLRAAGRGDRRRHRALAGPAAQLPARDGLRDAARRRRRGAAEQAALQAPMFETRWRWNATRSLALLRIRGGKRVPPPLQRMRARRSARGGLPGADGLPGQPRRRRRSRCPTTRWCARRCATA